MRETLLETAIEHFGCHGFEGAATRAIAAEADTAMSSITYHFGGKEGLYLACADHIAATVAARFGPLIDQILAEGPIPPARATDRLIDLLHTFASLMLDPASAGWSRFIVREQSLPTGAFDRLYDGAMKRVIECVIGLIRVARPDMEEEQARACAIAFWGQAIMLRTAHASVCRVMGVGTLDPATARILTAQFEANTRCVLCAPEPKP